MVILDPVLKEVNLQEKILQSLNERKVDFFVFDNLTDGANTQEIEKAHPLPGFVQEIAKAGALINYIKEKK